MYRHFIFIFILFFTFVWKVWHTDWIVECRYEYTDTDPPPSVSYGMEFYHPPQSPLWDTPTPAKLSSRINASWRDWEFFEGGGIWGPIEEPHLHVHWLRMIGRIFGVVFPAFLLVYGIAEYRDKLSRSWSDRRR